MTMPRDPAHSLARNPQGLQKLFKTRLQKENPAERPGFQWPSKPPELQF